MFRRAVVRLSSSRVPVRGFARDGSKAETLKLRFATPTEVLYNNKSVHSVSLPAVTGVMGVFPDHVPSLVELKPGVVIVNDTADPSAPKNRWFVSGGFGIVKDDSSASITVSEAVPLDHLDLASAQRELSQAQTDLSSASNPQTQAEARINVEVQQAIIAALEQK